MGLQFLESTGSKVALSGILVTVIGVAAYALGYHNGQQSSYKPSVFQGLQANHTKEVEQEAKKIEVELNSQLFESEDFIPALNEQSPPSADLEPIAPLPVEDAAQLKAKIDQLREASVMDDDAFYADPHQDKPKTSTGMSEELVSNYQQETGITNEDIEKAMNRHK